MKKIAAIFLLFALILSGCAPEEHAYIPTGDSLLEEDPTSAPTEPGELPTLSMAYYPDRSLNPFQATDYTNRALFSLIYQGLFTVSRAYAPMPLLCESYSVSADMQTWTFHIAKATFSDGTAVTAEDVSASLTASKGSPWYGNRLQHVKSISVSGNAVVLKTDTPFENLPVLLDIPVVKAGEVAAAQPLGSGPYRLDGNQLRRQAGWWCEATLPFSEQTIPLTVATSSVQIRNEFENTGVNLVCTDPGAKEYVDFRNDYELWDCENGLFMYLVCHKESPVFSNDKVRTALTHAIDRDDFVATYYHGLARSATLPASPQFPYYHKKLASNYGFDKEKFTQAVTDAKLESNEVTLLVSTGDVNRRQIAMAIADTLTECGLSVTVNAVSASEMTKQLKNGKFDLYLGQTRLSANMDLSGFFATKGTMNYGKLSDAATYHMCLEALANVGNYYALHKMVMENAWLCPVLFQSFAIYGQRGIGTELSPARDAIFYYDLGKTLADIKK